MPIVRLIPTPNDYWLTTSNTNKIKREWKGTQALTDAKEEWVRKEFKPLIEVRLAQKNNTERENDKE